MTINLRAASDTGSSNSDDLTNAASLVFDVVFSESVTGLATNDFSNAGAAPSCSVASVTGSGATYVVTLNSCGTGIVTLRLRTNAVTDSLGNQNAQTDGPPVTIDRTAPTVSIAQAAGQADPTGTSPIGFAAVFSEPVTGFATGDVTVGGTSGGTKSGAVTGSGTTYPIAVSGMTTSGTVVATIAAGVASDAAGNTSAAATPGDNTVTWDATAPTTPVVNIVPAFVNLANRTAVSITVSGEVGATVALSVTDGTTSVPVTGTIPAGGTLTTTPNLTGLADGTITASATLTDPVGNTSGTGSDTAIKDTVAPGVAINQGGSQADPTNSSPIVFTAVFSESVTGFATGDVTIGGTSGGTKTGAVSGGPATYTVSVTGMTVSGTVVATVAAGVATDAAGNPSTVSTSTDNTVTWSRATQLAFQQQPTDTVYGSTIAPAVTVRILDANGSTVTESTAQVTLTLAPSGPTLGGTLTLAAVSGVATFAGLTVNQVGAYTLGAASTGLTGATSASFVILPAMLTITPDDQTKIYGTTFTFDGTEFTATGLVGADDVATVTLNSAAAAPTATVGGSPYAIVAGNAIGTGLGNYTITYLTGSFAVTPAPLQVVADDRSKTYGDAVTFAGTEIDAIGLLNADTVLGATLSSPGAPASATVAGSPYPISPSDAIGSGLGNYTIQYVAGELTVSAAPLTITADDRAKVYGETFTFTGDEFTTSGLVNADTVTTVTLSSPGSPATATVAGSPYAITASAAVGNGLANYDIDYVDGELEVTTAPLTVTADDRTKTYGDVVTFAGTEFTTAGLLNADQVTSVTLASAGAVDSAAVAGSPYAITPSGAVGSGLDNYDITYTDGALTVLQAVAAIVVTGYTVTYDGLPHTATGSAMGVLGEDLSAGLDLAATTHTAAGSYLDAWTFADADGNYADSSDTVANTIDQAALTITADDQAKASGDTFVFAGTEFTTSGLRNADTVDSASLSSAGAGAAASPGTYAIAISGAVGTGLANYEITYEPGTMTVGNTAPAVGNASVTTGATAAVGGSVTITDPDTGQSLTVTIAGGPANGSATVANDGTFTYTPTGEFTGADSFTIQACDDAQVPACDTGSVSVTVHPVAVDDDDVVIEGETVRIDVQANDIGDTGEVEIVSGPSHGTARVGSIIYTPDAGFVGTDLVVYRVCSPVDVQVCDEATLTITVVDDGLPSTDASHLPPAAGRGSVAWLSVGWLFLGFAVGSAALAWLAIRRRGAARR